MLHLGPGNRPALRAGGANIPGVERQQFAGRVAQGPAESGVGEAEARFGIDPGDPIVGLIDECLRECAGRITGGGTGLATAPFRRQAFTSEI